ncbi:MAG: twin transmembrane helix small protein [Pseudomonadota bacterium]
MSGVGSIVLIGLMLATAAVLIAGIALMARGGEANRKYGNKLMVARVALQAGAIAMLVLLLVLKK